MTKAIAFTLCLLVGFVKIQAQNPLADTVQFNQLPDELRKTIDKHLSTLLVRDTLAGDISFVRNSIKRIYIYTVYISEGKLRGFYTYSHQCSNCITSNQYGVIIATAMYCCKDPKHSPQETAMTREEILAIQRQKGCSKVGVCIY